MRILTEDSPYRLADPTVAGTNLTTLSRMAWDTDTPDPAWAGGLPCCQTPAITPAGYAADRPRGLGLFRLPFPYLPDIMWMRRPGETIGVYQMRILLTLDLLDLIAVDGQGVWYAAPDGLPDTDDGLQPIVDAFDGLADREPLDTIRRPIRERAGHVWPDGYPVGDMMSDARTLTVLCMRGSAVLTGNAILQAGVDPDEGLRRHAIDMIRAGQAMYGPLFCPDPSPDGLRRWVGDNSGLAVGMVRGLADAGLEPAGSVDMVGEVLA